MTADATPSPLAAFKDRIRTASADRLGRLGIDVRRTRGFSRGSFYVMPRSCQIPNVGYIYETILGQRQHGTFVEVGANDGVAYSNTWGLAERGWRGLLFEPIPTIASKCRANHRDHRNVQVLETAVADRVGEISMEVAGVLSSANSRLMDEYRARANSKRLITGQTIVVPSQTLDVALARHGVEPSFDVLVVDVEGFEGPVFRGFSLETWRPKILVVELTDLHPVRHATRHVDFEIQQRILAADYQILYKDTSNTVFGDRQTVIAALASTGL